MDDLDLEKTYSREQQRLGHELDETTTSHRQVSNYIQRKFLFLLYWSWSVLLRNIGNEANAQFARIRTNEEDVDAQLELEKENELDETGTFPADSTPLPEQQRKIIRFDDGDPAQPNNWPRVRL